MGEKITEKETEVKSVKLMQKGKNKADKRMHEE